LTSIQLFGADSVKHPVTLTTSVFDDVGACVIVCAALIAQHPATPIANNIVLAISVR
jgi:hypothetical protein